MTKGLFVVFEGLDGAGTTTQTALLRQYLESSGRVCVSSFEPTDLTLGKVLRTALRGQWGEQASEELKPEAVALLFAADRLDHLTRRVEPAMGRGEIVISDRYVYSSLAYQGSLLSPEWVQTINQHAREPDLTVYVRVSVETSLSRVGSRGDTRDIYEKEEMLRSVFTGYESLVERGEMANLVVVDGEQSVEKVFNDVTLAIQPLLSL